MDNDLKGLLQAWFAEDFDEKAVAPLLERLRSDEAFRKSFVGELEMLGQLRAVQSSEPRWMRLEDALGETLDEEFTESGFEETLMRRVADSNEADASEANSTEAVAGADPLLKQLTWVLGLAAALFFAAWFVSSRRAEMRLATEDRSGQQNDRSTIPPLNRSADSVSRLDEPVASHGIAVLSQSVGGTWDGLQQPSVGDSLGLGRLILNEGTVQIEFLAGVRLLLRAPADIELRAADEILIREGVASCYVTEMGRGFRIVTNEMEVIDLGTAFSIEVKEGRESEVHVLEGAVEIKSGQRDAVQLVERKAIRMGKDGPQDVAYSPKRFPQMAEIRQQQRNRAQRRFEAWQGLSAKLSEDPSVLLHYDFQEDDPSALELTNRASHSSQAISANASASHVTNGVVIGCQWQTGRWPGKRALQYRNPSDRVMFQIPGAYDELTFLVWVRVDALTQRLTSLLMTEHTGRRSMIAPASESAAQNATERLKSSQVKSVRWELLQHRSRVMFSVAHEIGQPLWSYDIAAADHDFTLPANWGQWACMAVTCDIARQKIRHYLNGDLIGEGNLVHRAPLTLEFMELGNFSVSDEELEESGGIASRRFYGAFDELIIARRSFSPAEIKDIWTVGKP